MNQDRAPRCQKNVLQNPYNRKRVSSIPCTHNIFYLKCSQENVSTLRDYTPSFGLGVPMDDFICNEEKN